ncbi:MAG: hypothetical protein Q9217_002927 [Psora testacea]
MTDVVSPTRLYLGNLPRDVTKEDIQSHFAEGPGNITEIKLMNGFGFIEYEDAADARDVVPHYRKSPIKARLAAGVVSDMPMIEKMDQTSKATASQCSSHVGLVRETIQHQIARIHVLGARPFDLKDFARRSGLDVVYSEVGRDRDGKGFVEFETSNDLKIAVDKLDNQEFKGNAVRCMSDIQDEIPGRNDRYRSRSPPPFRRGGYPPPGGYYDDRRGPPPPRGYRDERDDYRRRSPLPRDDYYSRHSSYRSPPPRGPPRGPPLDDYPPARGGYGREPDPYGAPPPRRGGYEEPYAANGYDRSRRTPPPPRAYGGGYDERPPPRYW